MNSLKLIETLFNAVKKHKYLIIILDVENNTIRVKVWNKARWVVTSMTGEFLQDFFLHEDIMKNNIIEHLFKEGEGIKI
jgi:hypothetical protein